MFSSRDLFYAAIAHKKTGDLDGATKLLETCSSMEPNRASVWRALGNLRMLRGENSGAIDAYARAVTLRPRKSNPWLALARLFISKRWIDEAYYCANMFKRFGRPLPEDLIREFSYAEPHPITILPGFFYPKNEDANVVNGWRLDTDLLVAKRKARLRDIFDTRIPASTRSRLLREIMSPFHQSHSNHSTETLIEGVFTANKCGVPFEASSKGSRYRLDGTSIFKIVAYKGRLCSLLDFYDPEGIHPDETPLHFKYYYATELKGREIQLNTTFLTQESPPDWGMYLFEHTSKVESAIQNEWKVWDFDLFLNIESNTKWILHFKD